ncbi:MAG: hypothetical protein QOI42_672 [Frankiaceae bacterium]|nr:hypothetical protein [Frankiaceae bacterium]
MREDIQPAPSDEVADALVDDTLPETTGADAVVEHSTVRQELARFVRLRWSMATWRALVAIAGALLALTLAGSVHQQLGPVDTTLSLRPAGLGDTRINVPPLGNLGLDTHDGPLQLDVTVDQVRLEDARRLFSNPKLIDSLQADITRELEGGLIRLLVKGVLVAFIGAILLTGIVYRRKRDVRIAAGVTAIGLAVTAAYAGVTWRGDALKTPTYTGLLALAPQAIGNVEDIQTNFSRYGDELSKIVSNVSKLYNVTSDLPSGPSDLTTRVLFISDVHDNPLAFDVVSSVIKQFGVAAVIDTGDISDHGLPSENGLYSPVRTLGVPYVFVRGNHDSVSTEAALRAMPNVTVLDNSVTTVAGLRIAGSGDPMFTPDQSHPTSADQQALELQDQGERLAALFGATTTRPAGADIVLVHEPPAAAPLYGRVPLVLAGHTHERRAEMHDGTQLLVQGSSGGAGLRGLEHETPTPLQLSVLYFDPTSKQLVAYDDLQLGGLGSASVEIRRHAVKQEQLHIPGTPLPTPGPSTTPPPAPSPTTDTPSPSTTPPSTTPPGASAAKALAARAAAVGSSGRASGRTFSRTTPVVGLRGG